MHRTGYEHALWHLAKELQFERLAAPGLVALWVGGWLAFVLAVFTSYGL
jgi:hypothetical protein